MFVALVKDDREMWIIEEREVMEYFRKGFKDYYKRKSLGNHLALTNGTCISQMQQSNPWML